MADESQFQLITPLGSALRLHKVLVREKLCHISQFSAECLADSADIDINEVLGKMVSIRIALPDLGKRYLCGYVTRFAHVGTHGRFQSFQCVIHTWPWFLTRTTDCRIFQQKSVPDIIKDVFADHQGLAEFRDALTGTYKPRDYCVQYRESDFDFVCRLMEEEGIYFFFEHDQDKNVMVLADAVSAHNPVPGFDIIPFVDNAGSRRDAGDYITDWHFEQSVQSGKTRLFDYDFERPKVKLDAKGAVSRDHEHADAEVFDYPGGFTQQADGDQYASVRIDEIQSQHEQAKARSNVRAAGCGMLFKLDGHVRREQDREYLVLACTMHMKAESNESTGDGGSHFSSELIVLPSAQTFRPVRRTPQPVVKGPHTAVVVGPSGDEIYTDKYGRVKVQFHWDRLGKNDENSSCWMRVSTPWAGKNWGFVSIPRIGQEVVVEFLEGNPDRPLITGSVYNGEQMPPYELPANMTQSGIKSRSTKGGSTDNFNEIRFEDKKGSEQVYVHAEKNMDTIVENNETRDVGNDRKTNIGNDEVIDVKNNRTETVGAEEKITIGANRTEDVAADEKITIGANRTEIVGANEEITIGGTRQLTVGSSETVTIGAGRTETIGAALSQTIGAASTISIAAGLTQTVGAAVSMTSGGPTTITAAGGLTIIAPGGTKIIDFELAQVGGTIKEGYAIALNFNIVSTEMNAAKAEITAATTALIGAKAEKIGVEAGQKDAVAQMVALEALSNATSIEMDTLKVLL